MPTEEKSFADMVTLTAPLAHILLSTAPKMKPIAPARALCMGEEFQVELSPGGYLHGDAGDYLVLTPDGAIKVLNGAFIDSFFEPVKKRTRTKGD